MSKRLPYKVYEIGSATVDLLHCAANAQVSTQFFGDLEHAYKVLDVRVRKFHYACRISSINTVSLIIVPQC